MSKTIEAYMQAETDSVLEEDTVPNNLTTVPKSILIKSLDRAPAGSSIPLERVKAEFDRAAVLTHNRRLAEHLKVLLGIGDGREVVPLIGSCSDRNNLEAILTWVVSQGAEIKEFEFSQQIEILGKELQRAIDKALERFKMY